MHRLIYHADGIHLYIALELQLVKMMNKDSHLVGQKHFNNNYITFIADQLC